MADNDKTIGGRGRRNINSNDVHATGKATRDNNNDIHATGKATRGNDTHSTGKAARPSKKKPEQEQENLKPYEQQGNDDLRRRLNEKGKERNKSENE